jgi:nucleotide-binding universal stress UspA family protein
MVPMLRRRSFMTTPKTILVPTDFGDVAAAALDYAIELATAFDARIVLLHAFEIPAVGFPDAALGLTADLGSRILEGARAGLDGLLAERKGLRVPIQTRVEQNDAWRAILDVAQRESVDLIVIGTHGRRGLPRALLGSVAEKVVRMSPIPVLTVRPADAKQANPQ